MDLDSFYEKEFKDYSLKPENFCNICYCEHDSSSVVLKCNHKYHYECILHSYKINNTKKKRACPYCRSDGGYLPLLKDTKPEKNIHREYTTWLNKDKKQNSKSCKQCIGVVMNGPNKNSRCVNKATKGDYCGMHKKQKEKGISYDNLD